MIPWLVAGGLAALAGLAVGQLAAAAQEARVRWGQTRSVLVVTRPVAAGRRLAGAVERLERPLAVLPEGALDRLPSGSRAAHSLARGDAVTRTAVASTASRSAGEGVGDDQRLVAVTQPQARLAVHVGDHVDVWSTLDASVVGAGRPTTSRVAVGTAVVAVHKDIVTLAVPARDAAAVAEASALGAVTLAGVPPARGGDP